MCSPTAVGAVRMPRDRGRSLHKASQQPSDSSPTSQHVPKLAVMLKAWNAAPTCRSTATLAAIAAPWLHGAGAGRERLRGLRAAGQPLDR